MSWLWCGVSALLILGGMALGPGEGGSVALLVVVLLGIVLGIATTVWSLVLAGRALRGGRMLGGIPLLLDSALLFWGFTAVLGTFGRFYGWDA